MSPSPKPSGRLQGNPYRAGTVIETDEDIRQALEPGAAPARATISTANPYRPMQRPPVALLIVYDDGKTDGETIRIRTDSFVVGRTEGDLLLPHDALVSTRHLEITRQHVGGLFRWVLTDLQSTNGLYIRVTRAALHDRAEILVGNGRYRFEAPEEHAPVTADDTPPDPHSTGSTHGWDSASPRSRPPALSELLREGIGNRMVFTRPEYWIGTDPACAICRPDDPFCEPRHVRIFRGPGGGWYAEHAKTANGLWYRVPQVVVDKSIQFQIGEQRFRLRVS